ncbi:hypothetical protein GCM10023093_02760 [Nemorincola caseinilytica]|uniref:BIG2 domain-containing protein n=1 Tax=Nemorincola caseinilytica TaxID=2054315 RepID=A0ABP8N5E4_9BACT
MKKKIVLLPFICALIYVLLGGNAGGPGAVSNLELTGITGTASCGGASCHTMSGSVLTTIELIGPLGSTTSYTPGGTYNIRISGFNASTTAVLPRFGFQVSAVTTATSLGAGSMTPPIAIFTQLSYPAGGIEVVEHASSLPATSGTGAPGTSYVLNIPWTAPGAGTGSVTLRGILNAVNGDATNAGDAWGAGSLVVTETTGGPAGISGASVVCVGASTTLTHTTAGGTWSSSAPGVASISSGGVVTGLTPGTTTISYTLSSGTATHIMTVNPNPGPISGTPAVCPGGTTPLSNSTAGGTWSSSNTAVATVSATGVVSGVSAGTTTISYIIGATGCYSTATVTVNTVPAITGTTSMCTGGSTTLSHSIPGGTWSSSTPVVATVSSTGVVNGISAGTSTISYTFGTSGCAATTVVTVNGVPDASITGSSTACVSHTTTLTGSPTGGTWTSLNTARATVGASTGIVTGVTLGTVTIKYKVVTACGTDSATHNMNVLPAASCPTGIVATPVQEDGLRILPNPNSGDFAIRINSLNNEMADLVISDMAGRVVERTTAPTNTDTRVRLDVPPGIYFIAATWGPQRYITKIEVK